MLSSYKYYLIWVVLLVTYWSCGKTDHTEANLAQIADEDVYSQMASDSNWQEVFTLIPNEIVVARSQNDVIGKREALKEADKMWHFELSVRPLSADARDKYRGDNPYAPKLSWDSLRFYMKEDLTLLMCKDTLDAAFCNYVEDGKVSGALKFLIGFPKPKNSCDQLKLQFQDKHFRGQLVETQFDIH